MTRTFETQIAPRGLGIALTIPPLAYWTAVAMFDEISQARGFSLGPFLALLALAHGLPLGALAWVCLSVAACTVTSDKLILHSVARDDSKDLALLRKIFVRGSSSVELDLGGRRIRLRLAHPEAFLAALSEARQRSWESSGPANDREPR